MLAEKNHTPPATPEALVRAYKPFAAVAGRLLHIHDENSYQAALRLLERLLDAAPDDPDSLEHDLVRILSLAIEQYELTLPKVRALNSRVDAMPADISTLRLLMDQHGLTGADFENEIGKRSYVSQILSGDKKLTRQHIEKLAERFSIPPALFFG